MNAACDQVEGRSIHMSIDVWLSPPTKTKVGHTDPAIEIGRGLINESVGLLVRACEAEGFMVKTETHVVVY